MSNTPRNWTPTFKLTSIEKPDMSPYLFHMTTEESLQSILQDQEVGENEGKLIAQTPRHCSDDKYNVPMVCFTDTPPFALDFFRYRWSNSKDRENLKYGIGFDKRAMVAKGVYPTFYANKQVQSQVFGLIKMLKTFDSDNWTTLECEYDQISQQLKKIHEDTLLTLESIKKIMFPLLEDNKYEGYIWEREWRYTSPNNTDFIFSYEDIRIICCTDKDESNFKEIIGENFIKNNPIQFMRTWEEYNEITDFLNKRTQDMNNDIDKRIEKVLAERKGVERYLSHFLVQEQNISKLRQFKDELNIKIKKIALVKVFEKISNVKADSSIKHLIMDNDYEIVITAIAVYYQQKENKIPKPLGFLTKAIQEQWKPRVNEKEKKETIAIITNLMNHIIENDLEINMQEI
ncbi:abortive infection system antitoxin AbiGi family protein [Anabaena lutea]|uniref:Uncharacterized protein n=1 Tax=Anabaena lutea FACHB-196 TaxID=2692881 RepID=A0ABR8FBF1_9NOST|nr:abortive infection system antitoxin AbiGi family protein [Anabaena lutea]MBD2567089.1 hypothetical protein [Anabaena lutea FACHB-196]